MNYKLEDSNSEKSLSNQLYEVTIIFKSFGRNMNHEQKHFIGQLFLQFIRKQILNGDFTFDDGRSAVIHILDAFYRADAQEYRFFSQEALLILQFCNNLHVSTYLWEWMEKSSKSSIIFNKYSTRAAKKSFLAQMSSFSLKMYLVRVIIRYDLIKFWMF